jgi:hypothetical protein
LKNYKITENGRLGLKGRQDLNKNVRMDAESMIRIVGEEVYNKSKNKLWIETIDKKGNRMVLRDSGPSRT